MYIREQAYHTLGESPARFEGAFTGSVSGDNNTMATVAVISTHRDNTIEGEITLGRGLVLDFGGTCGLEPVDLEKIPISGSADPANALHFQTSTQVKEPTNKFPGVKYVVTNVIIAAVLSEDGQTMDADITLEPVKTEPKIPFALATCRKRVLRVRLKKQESPTGSLKGLAQAPTLPNLSDWKDLISFRPPTGVQRKILGGTVGWKFHRIEDAASLAPVNLDYYPVKVSRIPQIPGVYYPGMPNVPGAPSGADLFLRHIRQNINDFIDKRLTLFSPWNKSEENIWRSSNPLGAVLHLDFYLLGGAIVGSIPIDDGSVVVSDYLLNSRQNYWRVYTIWTPQDHGHPVSGVREWGYRRSGNDYIFYTKAADRITKSLALPFKERIYDAQNQLWLSFQRAIEMFVNNNGGQAQVLTPIANRYDWGQVAGQYHRPTINWL